MSDLAPLIRPGMTIGPFKIVHVLAGRVRLKSLVLCSPTFDVVYFEAVLEALPGVEAARINAVGGSLVIVYDGTRRTWEQLAEYLQVIPEEAFSSGGYAGLNVSFSDVLSQALGTLLSASLPFPLKAVLGWSLSAGTVLKGIETLVQRGIKVEVLDATAIMLSLLRGNYFTAGAINTLLSLGEYLEGNAEQRSTELLKGLLRPQAESLWVMRNGTETNLPAEEVVPGDLVVFGSGELIAVDGVTYEGEASVNQSSISGESVPVHIKPGDAVISGSIVEEGRLIVRVERIGSETSMARIGRFIDQSLRSKSKKQTKSSELADKLVPITMGLSGLMFLVTRDLNRTASVLTVDFSCAVKLTNPVAVRSGMYAAGQAGVLLKGAAALDALQDVDTLVFDKTGTLTTGRLSVTDILPLNGISELALLSLAAGAEEHYDHPVARAVVHEAKMRQLSLPLISRVDFIVAHGVSASIDGQSVLVGSHHFIAEDEGVDCCVFDAQAQDLRAQGKSLLYVAREGILVGVIAMRDDPRPEAADVLNVLKSQGIKRIVVLTGDHKDTALALARRLPQIDEIRYQLRPEDKAAIVDQLKAEGCQIAYVGDGVNDAPALVNAHVGICMPEGADLAKEAAQVLLLKEDLHMLSIARAVANRTNTIIRQCFAATIGFNSTTMLLAALGLPPVGAAILHNLSTVGILGYAAVAASKSLENSEKHAPMAHLEEIAC